MLFSTLGNVHNYNVRAAANQSDYFPRMDYSIFVLMDQKCGTLLKKKDKIVVFEGF